MRIALLMDQSTSYGRGVFAGVRRRLLVRLDCRLVIAEPTAAAWGGVVEGGIDGAIAHVASPSLSQAITRWGGPAVNVSASVPSPLPAVGLDNIAIGRLAADVLIGRRCASFAYVGRLDRLYGRERRDGLEARLIESGKTLRSRDWGEDPVGLAAWVKRMPAPVGLLVGGDELGVRVIAACVESGMDVPGRVRVLSATEDPTICELARPTLSSIASDTERIGDEAVSLLLRLVNREAAPADPIRFGPLHVIERASTASGTHQDPAVTEALRWLTDHATEPVGVDHVARAVGVGRRSLERRFLAMTGRSIYQQLLALRLDLAKRLLRTTELPLSQVATQCGFAGARHLCEAFRLRDGRTPGSYRSSAG